MTGCPSHTVREKLIIKHCSCGISAKQAAGFSGQIEIQALEVSDSVLGVLFVLSISAYASTAMLPGITLELLKSCLQLKSCIWLQYHDLQL